MNTLIGNKNNQYFTTKYIYYYIISGINLSHIIIPVQIIIKKCYNYDNIMQGGHIWE